MTNERLNEFANKTESRLEDILVKINNIENKVIQYQERHNILLEQFKDFKESVKKDINGIANNIREQMAGLEKRILHLEWFERSILGTFIFGLLVYIAKVVIFR